MIKFGFRVQEPNRKQSNIIGYNPQSVLHSSTKEMKRTLQVPPGKDTFIDCFL